MDDAKDATEDFVTVVSVGSQPASENFVTVLSIGSGKKDDEQQVAAAPALSKVQANGLDGHLEEEVEVFRLPGERLGFGLKFEGGNKTTERVRRLFVQSCAEQSPASRAKCSWGTLGEGDEVLSIDGVPVTHMTRLDSVRRLKESQLVIRLMVRCRGALRPEVVSAERKATLSTPERSKVPPELPAAPPPVPPRKLRQTRGLADGEANPSPAKKSWDSPAKSQNGSPNSKSPLSKSQNGSQNSSQNVSQNASQNASPKSQASSPKMATTQLLSCSNKTSAYESCESSPRVANGPNQESPKGSPPERSPELSKSKEPPEAMVYLDARSQCGSTHGSTSDDTGSSLSTVVDRFSTSDRVSTVSTASTASTTSEQHLNGDQESDQSTDHDLQLSRAVCPLEHLEREFQVNQPDYLLRRLASSEAVTHVESRGEVERITAVVAPNTVLIEETITLQPPLSFQDAPLSYGHETRPDLFYSADLAADSTTHFRPIKDDAELVERVNGDREEFAESCSQTSAVPATASAERTKEAWRPDADKTPPPLPARNHVNRIPVNQQVTSEKSERPNERPSEKNEKANETGVQPATTVESQENAPVLPPKPLPRKDVKVRRKRPPPPPPPTVTPRRETRSTADPASVTSNESQEACRVQDKVQPRAKIETNEELRVDTKMSMPRLGKDVEVDGVESRREGENDEDDDNVLEEYRALNGSPTNKVLEIIEIRKAKALSPPRFGTPTCEDRKERLADVNDYAGVEVNEDAKSEGIANGERSNVKDANSNVAIKDTNETLKNGSYSSNDFIDDITKDDRLQESSVSDDEDSDSYKEALSKREDTLLHDNSLQQDGDDDETYKSLDEINDDLKITDVNRIISDEEMMDDDESTSDESDDGDYYWQSNLATIGEEEETNSLEYTSANKDASDAEPEAVESSEPQLSPTSKMDAFAKTAGEDAVDSVNGIVDYTEEGDKKSIKETVNGRMENCGGGQRLPPDGDEFPASYQEFSSNNSQQYQRFAATARTTTMTSNGANVVEGESFVGGEGFKILSGDSSVVSSRSILLPDNNRIVVSSVESIRQEAVLSPQESRHSEEKVPYQAGEEAGKRAGTAVSNYSTYCSQSAGNGNILVSEKKIEIAGYYHKEVPSVEKEVQSHAEKETSGETPPPLPLTGPPKMDTVNLHGKSVPPPVEPPPRKFSLNSELWRQDDKSERSVRDKIAMFSSQSSLDTPLFPSPVTVASVTTNGRRLSKYKSTEDMCADEKIVGQKEKSSFFADRTQSSFDLTDSARSFAPEARKYGQRSPSLSKFEVSPVNSTASLAHAKQPPPVPQKTSSMIGASPVAYETKQNFVAKPYSSPTSPITPLASQQNGNIAGSIVKSYNTLSPTNSAPKTPTTTVLTRATSFSGSTPYVQEKTTISEPTSPQISRTNSLASTFRKPNEDMRRASLNQLIEQRRRSISKLRGLVIPEKDTVSIDQPIVDLPEIKSRDSILLHQMPKANIQDKWGSQSSLASTTSTASVPLKATTSFKMPAPQINSKYSPAFKRKSLTVYGTSANSTNTINGSNVAKDIPSTPTTTSTATPTTNLASEPPKSLESICSPTRSDYSFEYLSTTSSPDALRTRSRIIQRKTRMDYDDSDNDSAVSSSQSSISRGFSPPMSPVPSERSTVSSERSYVSTETNYQRRSMMDGPTNRGFMRDSVTVERDSQYARPSIPGERSYVSSERSSSSSSGSNPRSPQPNESLSNSRNSQIPQRQTLRRSNSTDTNCSTSSTLTSGSQASAESLSRRVLKPQSVEAINRKNILASARCRSGRDLNGSPLIQRKFSDDEDASVTSTENGTDGHHQQRTTSNGNNGVGDKQDVKIAYIDVTDSFADEGEESYKQKIEEEPKLPPKRSVPPPPAVRPPKSDMLEPSNDLKMWVRAEAKALIRSTKEKSSVQYEKTTLRQESQVADKIETSRNDRTSGTVGDEVGNLSDTVKSRHNENEVNSHCLDVTSSRSRANVSSKKASEDQNDLLTILTTRSRSRSAIHVDDGTFGKSKSQMSLEDILGAKGDGKPLRGQAANESRTKNGIAPVPPPKPGTETRNVHVAKRASPAESWTDEKPFVSKIPTFGRSRITETSEDGPETEKSRSTISKIPTVRSLGRRSASVTDMKKALEKVDSPSSQHQTSNTHSRFPSLDSSVDENVCPMGVEVDADRCCGEQFGSISSLASSTSLISQQELAQLVEEASLEEARGAHDVIVVLLHKENPTGSVGITLAGGADCEIKEITVHRVLAHSIADKDGRVQRGDRILSINGRSTRGLTHRESLTVLKQPRSEVVLVVSRTRVEEGCNLRSRTASVETIVEGFETNGIEDTAWGPPATVSVYKDGAGLGFSLEGGRDSPLGDRPLVIKKIFTGGAAEKTGALKAGDQLLEVNGSDVTRMSRIEAWSLMKKLHDGEVNLLVRHPATKSS